MLFPKTVYDAYSYRYRPLEHKEPKWNYHHFKKKPKKHKK